MALIDIVNAFKNGRKFTDKNRVTETELVRDESGIKEIIIKNDDAFDYFTDEVVKDKASKVEKFAFYLGTLSHPLYVGRFFYDLAKEKALRKKYK